MFSIWQTMKYFSKWSRTGKYHDDQNIIEETKKLMKDKGIPETFYGFAVIQATFLLVSNLILLYIASAFYIINQGNFIWLIIISLIYVTIDYFIEVLGLLKDSLNLSGNKRLLWDLGSILFEIILYIYVPISILSK